MKYTIEQIIEKGLCVFCGTINEANFLLYLADSSGFKTINGSTYADFFKHAIHDDLFYNLKKCYNATREELEKDGVIDFEDVIKFEDVIELQEVDIPLLEQISKLKRKNAKLEYEINEVKSNCHNDKTIAVEDAVREVSNKYFEVFKILSEDNIDWKELGLRLANNHPEIFLKVSLSLKYPNTKHLSMQRWYDHAIKEVESGKKIRAIKYVRECTGLGLRESKAIVDDLAECMGL